ncbi:3-hydroxyacyl-CoA dehydrogenase NAD-binding domain-containing protein [Pseudoxanthobacter sp. M-2]|uniref:3-hydroxyacyl-CoA dehydrogenase NAD-binding domain-containing protein n=1 Tax=Pseudoxanthobacter sp. M-2 TaxID=3078754 RepID=UPI0038FCB1CD
MHAELADTHIAVLGAGLVGAGWAALFVHHGATVTVWDPVAGALDAAESRMAAPLAALSRLSPEAGPRGRLSFTPSLAEAVADADLIQENAPEKIPLKHALYAEVEAAAPAAAIIASSTSSLTWSELAPGLRRPERFITAHPFNPPHLVPLVELYGIDDAVLDRAEAIYRAAGRRPVRLKKDATGHIANRLASALWREAVNMVAEGIADVEAIDEALVHGPGLRWSVIGAHMAYHLGGGPGGIEAYLEHLGPSQERRWASLGNPRLTPAVRAALIEGVARKAAGRDIATLEAERDEALIRALRARGGEAQSG